MSSSTRLVRVTALTALVGALTFGSTAHAQPLTQTQSALTAAPPRTAPATAPARPANAAPARPATAARPAIANAANAANAPVAAPRPAAAAARPAGAAPAVPAARPGVRPPLRGPMLAQAARPHRRHRRRHGVDPLEAAGDPAQAPEGTATPVAPETAPAAPAAPVGTPLMLSNQGPNPLPAARPESAPARGGTPLTVRPNRPLALNTEHRGAQESWKLVLGLGVLGLAGWAWKRRQGHGPTTMGPELQIVRRASVSDRGELVVVDVAGQRMLLGVTPNSVQQIAVIDDDTKSDRDEAASESHERGGRFEDALSNARGRDSNRERESARDDDERKPRDTVREVTREAVRESLMNDEEFEREYESDRRRRDTERARRAELERRHEADRKAEADRRAEIERRLEAERRAETERRLEAERRADADRREAERRAESARLLDGRRDDARRDEHRLADNDNDRHADARRFENDRHADAARERRYELDDERSHDHEHDHDQGRRFEAPRRAPTPTARYDEPLRKAGVEEQVRGLLALGAQK